MNKFRGALWGSRNELKLRRLESMVLDTLYDTLTERVLELESGVR